MIRGDESWGCEDIRESLWYLLKKGGKKVGQPAWHSWNYLMSWWKVGSAGGCKTGLTWTSFSSAWGLSACRVTGCSEAGGPGTFQTKAMVERTSEREWRRQKRECSCLYIKSSRSWTPHSFPSSATPWPQHIINCIHTVINEESLVSMVMNARMFGQWMSKFSGVSNSLFCLWKPSTSTRFCWSMYNILNGTNAAPPLARRSLKDNYLELQVFCCLESVECQWCKNAGFNLLTLFSGYKTRKYNK